MDDGNIYVTLASGCIWLDYKSPYKRNWRYFYRPYRNYYGAGGKDVEVWDVMVGAGYAAAGKKDR